jgi:hypothetical protein
VRRFLRCRPRQQHGPTQRIERRDEEEDGRDGTEAVRERPNEQSDGDCARQHCDADSSTPIRSHPLKTIGTNRMHRKKNPRPANNQRLHLRRAASRTGSDCGVSSSSRSDARRKAGFATAVIAR